MARGRVRLAVKLSTMTTLMVVASALAADVLARTWSSRDLTVWMFLFTVFSLLIGIIFTYQLDRIITVPVRKLMAYANTMVDNDYQTPVDLETGDEIGELGQSMDGLRRSFLAQRSALQELNRSLDARVAARTEELREALEYLRQAQEQLILSEKLASVGKLAGGVAHEINNPTAIILTRVGLLVDTAREDGLSPDFVEGLEVINRQVARISRITQDLLTFSRMSPMRQGATDLSQVVSLTCSLFEYEARTRKVTLVPRVETGLMVQGDRDRLEQVVFNLLKNALDALEERGGGTVWVELGRREEEAELTVCDDGPGIPGGVLGRIFDPFFTTKAVGKGTGLGLAISYGILEEHRGSITAENRPGGGALLRVTLPLEVTPPPEGMPSVGQGGA